MSNIVAFGHVYESLGDGEKIHGLPLTKDCVKVEINMVEIPSSLLPRPSGEFLTVQDALKSFVAWPKELVLPISDETFCPDVFQQFYMKAKEAFSGDGNILEIDLVAGIVQQDKTFTINLGLEDVDYICNCQEITSNVILVYIRLLFEKMELNERQTMFGFLDPISINQTLSRDRFIRVVRERLENAKQKYIFIPYNVGRHWVLMVYYKGKFHLLDSLAGKNSYNVKEYMIT